MQTRGWDLKICRCNGPTSIKISTQWMHYYLMITVASSLRTLHHSCSKKVLADGWAPDRLSAKQGVTQPQCTPLHKITASYEETEFPECHNSCLNLDKIGMESMETLSSMQVEGQSKQLCIKERKMLVWSMRKGYACISL